MNITIKVFPLDYHYYLMFYPYGHIEVFRQSLGPLGEMIDMKEEVLDEMK